VEGALTLETWKQVVLAVLKDTLGGQP
jgi:hypothetical protein